MKRILLFALLFWASGYSNTLIAQGDTDEDNPKRQEKIEVLKRTYISEQLNLTVAEAEKFWPVYNEFNDQRKAIRKSLKQLEKNSNTITDEKKLSTQIDQISQKKKEEIDLQSAFLKNCLPILGVEKTRKLARLEQDFKKKLMQELKNRREGGGPGGGRPGGQKGTRK
jgi:phosphomevalonate kinase